MVDEYRAQRDVQLEENWRDENFSHDPKFKQWLTHYYRERNGR